MRTVMLPPVERLDTDLDPAFHHLFFDRSPEAIEEWIETFLTVPDLNANIVPFKLFPQQKQMLKDATGRDLIVKGRQSRTSSLEMAVTVREFTTTWGYTALTGAHDDATTELFRERIKHHLRDLKAKGLEYKLAVDNDNEMVIGGMDSRIIFQCLAGDTLIRVDNGILVPIREAVGRVYTHRNRRGQIRAVVSGGRRAVVEVTLPGEKIRCTPDHLFWTDRGWVKAADLLGRWVEIPDRKVGRGRCRSWPCETKKPRSIRAVPLTERFGFVCGLFLAEGSLGSGQLEFYLNVNERAIAEEIAQILSPYQNGAKGFSINPHPSGGKCIVLHVFGRGLERLFRQKFYRDGDKCISDSLIAEAPREFLRGLVQGYILGDGSPNSISNCMFITSTRPQLLTQLQDLILALHRAWGPIRRFDGNWKGKKTEDRWVLEYNGTSNFRLRVAYSWPLPDKRWYFHTTFKRKFCRNWVRVRGVRPAGDAEVYDIVLDHPDHSFRTVAAAVHNSGEKRIIGRSFAAQRVHFSEIAHWRQETVGPLVGGLKPSVPGPPNGAIVFESTPKGAEGLFYKEIMDAQPFNPSSLWTVHFYPWWMEPRYRVGSDPVADITLPANEFQDLLASFRPTPEENRLISKSDLRPDQILWRRFMVAEMAKTTTPFLQEYPESLEGCFVSVSGNYFSTADGVDHLEWYRGLITPPVLEMDTLQYNKTRVDLGPDRLSVWEFPDPTQAYVVYVDASSGEQGDNTDYTAINVLNASTHHKAARYRSKIAPRAAAVIAAAIGELYGNALLSVERGGYGSGVIERLQEILYPNLYYHYDPAQPKRQPKAGIYMTAAVRSKILENYRSEVVSHSYVTRDALEVQEMGTFDWTKVQNRMKPQAAVRGSHDDILMSVAGCLFIAHEALARHKSKRRAEEETILVGPHGLVIGREKTRSRGSQPWMV